MSWPAAETGVNRMIIDHFYICTDNPGRDVKRLVQLGLVEGEPNVHYSQGTANRRFFFKNSMLELLYLVNEEEAKSERTKPLDIWAQFKDRQRNRIGIIFIPAEAGCAENPFRSKKYQPLYLPEGLAMDVSENLSLEDPTYIFMDFAMRKENQLTQSHCINGMEFDTIKKYTLYLKDTVFSYNTKALASVESLDVISSDDNYIQLNFTGPETGQMIDLRPELPLVFEL